ncbi:MAG: hypothetical protein KKD47_06805, partial [Proteobacteria bacterium]|nr:hypothetical protein [Pseudomonadota bacterium]
SITYPANKNIFLNQKEPEFGLFSYYLQAVMIYYITSDQEPATIWLILVFKNSYDQVINDY